MGLSESASIGRIAIDPSNPDTRVRGGRRATSPARPAQRGLYRTIDGGKSWKLVLAPTTRRRARSTWRSTRTNPQIVYAAMWDHKRNNGARVYGGVGSGLFRSEDGGDTWERLQNIVDPLPAYDTAQTGLKQDASLGRIGVTVAPSDPEPRLRGHRLAVRPGQGLLLLRRRRRQLPRRRPRVSDLERLPVVVRAPVGRPAGQEPHLQRGRHRCVRRPTAARRGRRSAARTPTSTRWTGTRTAPGRVYLGNDGGMYRSDTNGVGRNRARGRKATDQPWNQSYHLAVSQQDPQRLTTGLQDNGSGAHVDGAAPSPTDPALTQWNAYGGGDGHWNVIDPVDQTYYYECFQPSPPRHRARGSTTRRPRRRS